MKAHSHWASRAVVLCVVGVLGWSSCRLGPGEKGDSCKAHGDCDSDLVCVDSKCATPYARRWRLTVESARLSDRDSAGDPWDGDGSGPDPYVVVAVDGQTLLRTQERADTFAPAWNESVAFVLNRDTQVQLTLWDADFLIPGSVAATSNSIVREDELRQETVTAFATTGRPDAGNAITSITWRWTLDE